MTNAKRQGLRAYFYGAKCPYPSEASARRAARKELRRQGFKYDRNALCWARHNGYGLINFTRRWLRLSADGLAVVITTKRPPRSRTRQAFIEAAR